MATAINGTIYSDDGSLWVAMSIAKATLIGILNKLETTKIFNSPYLNHEDVLSAYRMSSLYVILHCYENWFVALLKKYSQSNLEIIGGNKLQIQKCERK